jgi:hypothetical protein
VAAYSGISLVKKLGIVEGARVALLNEPTGAVGALPESVTVVRRAQGQADVVVAFFVTRADFERRIETLGRMIFPAGGAWVAWPKRSSGVATTMSEDVVRAVGQPLGLVDNKVCAIDDTWTGLRLVWRREHRH